MANGSAPKEPVNSNTEHEGPNVLYSKDPADFRYMAVNVPCQSACPALTNIPAYIRALYDQ